MRYLIILFTTALVFGACDDSGLEDLIEQHNVNLQDPVTIIASTDVEEATIGDKIRYAITIISDPELDVRVPQFGENLGGFAIKDFGQIPPKNFKEKTVVEQWYLQEEWLQNLQPKKLSLSDWLYFEP